MTAEPTLSDKQLADNVRAAAVALASAWNAAADAGLTVEANFIQTAVIGRKFPSVVASTSVRRITTEVL